MCEFSGEECELSDETEGILTFCGEGVEVLALLDSIGVSTTFLGELE